MIVGRLAGKWRGVIFFVVFCALAGAGVAAETAPTTRDTLVYKDGDRVHGTLVSRTGDEIVFKSDRFGELRVRAADVVVIKADKPSASRAPTPALPAPAAVAATPSAAAAVEKKSAKTAADKADEERIRIWDRFTPAVLTSRVRNYFGPWHGRFSVSTELVSDVADRNNSSYEVHMARKWKADEVQLNSRYDFSQTNHVTTTDLLKVWGQARHEFNRQIFGQYRPTSEWNRASRLRGLPNDYLLLQQEIGAGWNLLTKPSRKLRIGVSQNLFDTWNLTPPNRNHASRGIVSGFEEVELALPWRITLSQRGIWYPVRSQRDGYENRVELNKKLTETLSTSLLHEVRRHNPDGTATDYERLKILFGLDF